MQEAASKLQRLEAFSIVAKQALASSARNRGPMCSVCCARVIALVLGQAQ